MSEISLPKTFKAAIFAGPNEPLTFEMLELKEPGQGELLIKILATGVCQTDANVQDGTLGNSFPMVPGHEFVGDVVAVGPDEQIWSVGDRAGGGWHGGHDQTCHFCQRGLFQMCEQAAINGVTRYGGYAEYCLLRSEAAVRIPPFIDPAVIAPLLCAGVSVFNGIRHLQIPPGETLAIQGLGGLGHLAIQYASRMGYRVIALSSSASKRDFAISLGAEEYVDGSKEDHAQYLQERGGVACIVSTAPNANVVGHLIGGLAPNGKLLVLSPTGEISINTLTLISKSISVYGRNSGAAHDGEEAISFALYYGVECLIQRFGFDQAEEALEHMKGGRARFRAVICMN